MHRTLFASAAVAALLIGPTVAPARAEPAGDTRPPRPPHSAAPNAADTLKHAPHEESTKIPSPETVPGQLVVEYKNGTSASAQSATAGAAGARVERSHGSLAVVAADPDDLVATQARLESDPRVESVEPNQIFRALDTPNDPGYPTQAADMTLIRAPQAWDASRGPAAKVAVIDSGIDLDHPDLTGRIALAETFIGGGATDTLGHGTAVAGIIAATANNHIGITGVAPNVQLYSLKVLADDGSTTEDVLVQAIDRAVELDVDVINMSLGGYGDSANIEGAVSTALASGIVVVAAAGNDGVPQVSYPAAYAGVVAVGATDRVGDVAWFSNHDSALSVVAPGVNVRSTKLTPGAGGTYDSFSGTSFSAAFATGVAALQVPRGSVEDGSARGFDLARTAQDRGTPGFDTSYGYGIVDAVAARGGGQVASPTTASGDTAPNVIGAAKPIGLRTTETINPPTDEDWFRFTGTGTRLAITVTPATFSGNRAREMDPIIAVYDANRQLILQRDWELVGEPETVTINATASPYYVRVESYTGSSSMGAYALDIVDVGAYQSYGWTETGYVAPVTFPHSAKKPVVADVTGDDFTDLVNVVDTGSNSFQLRVHPGHGDGTWGAPLVTAFTGPVQAVQHADLNGDGSDDILVFTNQSIYNPSARVFWGSPTGMTAGPTWTATFASTVQLGDLDGDGAAEVLTQRDTKGVITTEWNGAAWVDTPVVTLSRTVNSLGVGDLDHDGLNDLVASDGGGLWVASHAGGPWTVATVDGGPGSERLTGLIVADLTADGLDDVVVTGSPEAEPWHHAFAFVQADDGPLEPLPPADIDLYTLDGTARIEPGGPIVLVGVSQGSKAPLTLRVKDGFLQRLDDLPFTDVRYYNSTVADTDDDGLGDIVIHDSNGLKVKRHAAPAPSPAGVDRPWLQATSLDTPSLLPATGDDIKLRSLRDLNRETVNTDRVFLLDGRHGTFVPTTVTLDAATETITVHPTVRLARNTVFTLVLADVADMGANRMPLYIRGFRTGTGARPTFAVSGTYTPVPGDFEGDGDTDVYWYSNGARDSDWLGSVNGFESLGSYTGMPSGHRPLLLDMDGDEYDDLLVYEPGRAHGPDVIVPGGPGKGDTLKGYFQQDATYVPLGGDFDGDGYDDLFWYGPGTTADQIWFGGPTSSSPWRKKTLAVNGTYRAVAGDFNGDGYDDVLWHGPGSTVGDSIWSFGPGGTYKASTFSISGTYTPLAGDYDGNGFDDILFYAPGSTADSLWMFARGGTRTTKATSVNGTYRPATGDFDGDGYGDLMWYAPGTAKDAMWWGSTTGPKAG